MLRQISTALLLGVALAYPRAEPVSKTTSLHGIQPPTITTPLGDVKGSILSSRLGRTIYAFKGLRYAKPPVNELRFQPPVPAEKWEGIFNATQDGASCPQPKVDPISEDCLFLNVYTNKLAKVGESPKRPVIVFYHDGNFYGSSGKSDEFGPQYLLDQDVVLVVPNYRIGALGFLSTSEKEVPGNFGLKDQVQALKWVKDNIASFGGNPDIVTIAGSGAGGASVSAHLVSPMSKGLFHRAIIMSGSLYGNWPLGNNQMELAKKQAKLVNCPYDTAKNIIQCLKTKPADELAKSISGFIELGDEPVYFWSPVIEQGSQTKFLPAHPVELVGRGEFEKVPVLAGVTSDEFGGRAYGLINNETALNELNKDFDKYAPIVFHYEPDAEITKAIKNVYFGDKPIDKTKLPTLAQIFTDALVGFNVERMLKVLAGKTEDLYYYSFSYKGKYSNCYLPDSNNTAPYGASHGDDLMYLFQSSRFPQFKETDPEIATVEKMTKLWANFATTGTPIDEPSQILDNEKWQKYSMKNKNYMNIGNKLVLSQNLRDQDKWYKEWSKLFPMSRYNNAAHAG